MGLSISIGISITGVGLAPESAVEAQAPAEVIFGDTEMIFGDAEVVLGVE